VDRLIAGGLPVPRAKARLTMTSGIGIEWDDEVTRLEQLGARRLEGAPRSEHGTRWVVMADPEGNEFCVCDAGQSG
jgi:predicted enzyme related to lactoylglutathione lyase